MPVGKCSREAVLNINAAYMYLFWENMTKDMTKDSVNSLNLLYQSIAL